MYRGFKWLLLITLATYSIALIALELATSQEKVRPFFTDIQGTVPLYGINTTLSTFLLWSAALLFIVSITCLRDRNKNKQAYFFFLSQACVFGYLGLDDRFQFHDGRYLNIFLKGHGDLTLLIVGLLEIFFLWKYRYFWQNQWKAKRPLLIASLLFCLMMVVDFFTPSEMVLRLSLEDLLKTWSNAFFFLFSWTICMEQINRLKANTHPIKNKTSTGEPVEIK